MSEHSRLSLYEMYRDLTDDEKIAENKRKFDRDKRIESKKLDTGI